MYTSYKHICIYKCKLRLSFGSPRILTVDGRPMLLRDGDLIVFGTQNHGVPAMCPGLALGFSLKMI